jgi:hypothetical protein
MLNVHCSFVRMITVATFRDGRFGIWANWNCASYFILKPRKTCLICKVCGKYLKNVSVFGNSWRRFDCFHYSAADQCDLGPMFCFKKIFSPKNWANLFTRTMVFRVASCHMAKWNDILYMYVQISLKWHPIYANICTYVQIGLVLILTRRWPLHGNLWLRVASPLTNESLAN